MLSAHDAAIYIIGWCLNHGIEITNLKLQKLLYFVQGEYCKAKDTRLISDDFYAWELGPVIPRVYVEYSVFASATLPLLKPIDSINVKDPDMIDKILKKYAYDMTWNLVEKSRQQDPWKYNYEIFGDGELIPYQSIADYFRKAHTPHV